MPKRSQARRSKTVKKHQQANLRRAEEASLEQLLKEKNLHCPGMKMKEMRELCSAIERSVLDHGMYQQSSIFDQTFPEDPTVNAASLSQEPSGSQERVDDSTDQPPYGPTSFNQFSPVTSPEKGKKTAKPNPASWEADDSDSDGFYSPEFPGPCCRQIHVVQVEVHPEPRTDDTERGMVQPNEVTTEQRIISPRKRQTIPANEWDSIDKF